MISAGSNLQVLGLTIYVNGQKLYSFNGDGVIFSTPTGSTAYNYAKTNKITCSSDTCTHNMVKIPAVAPTATTEGNNEYYHCTICNKFFKDAEGKQETTVERSR